MKCFFVLILGLLLPCCEQDRGTPAPSDRAAAAGDEPGSGKDPVYLNLSWQPVTSSDLLGYKVFVSEPDDDSGEAEQIASVSLNGDFDQKAPKIRVNASDDQAISALIGKKACFYVTAFNQNGESAPSDQVCVDL